MENDNDDNMELIFPLTEINGAFENLSNEDFEGLKSKREFVTLRERRRSQLHGHSILPLHRMDSGIDVSNSIEEPQSAIALWKKALKKISNLRDPWSEFKMQNLVAETARRHRYNAHKKTWVVDDILVKMQPEPFNRGAMRSCYRLKRVTMQSSDMIYGISKDVLKSSRNYVAKRYMEQVNNEVYFQDVLLQMDAKLWGHEYNKYHPPKQVDILQIAILEFPNRPGNPLYHLEHYIDGEYIKYNSNSGFVDDSFRFTPQAFSHFTFERSSHNLIVVDIQGVGDLWTDPQIHTANGLDYGDGNLGTRGMALFFHSHRCNPICHKLKLSKFDLAQTECAHLPSHISSKTEIKGNLDAVLGVSPQQYHDMMARCPNSLVGTSDPFDDDNRHRNKSECSSNFSNDEDSLSLGVSNNSSFSSTRFVRFLSESDASETITEEEDRQRFHEVAKRSARPSCVGLNLTLPLSLSPQLTFHREASALFFNESVLGQIHHNLANYHNCGRFTRSGDEGDETGFLTIDSEAALFHEMLAAKLGVKQAIVTLANLYLGLPTDVLSNIQHPEVDESVGETYMLQAALARDRRAMIFIARAYAKGTSKLQQSYKEAEYWYKEALEEKGEDEGGEFDYAEPIYILKAELANVYLVGSQNLPQDFGAAGDYFTEAGDDATKAMKGKMASKYYQLAEEAYAHVP